MPISLDMLPSLPGVWQSRSHSSTPDKIRERLDQLLFYHRRLHRYMAISLQITRTIRVPPFVSFIRITFVSHAGDYRRVAYGFRSRNSDVRRR